MWMNNIVKTFGRTGTCPFFLHWLYNKAKRKVKKFPKNCHFGLQNSNFEILEINEFTIGKTTV